jgi:hypothetical protein
MPIPTNDTDIQAFMAWLSPKDRLIHELAATMLKTRYTPHRSNAWIAFQKEAKK